MKSKRAIAFAGIAALSISLSMLPPSSALAAESIRLIAVDSDSSSSLWVKVFLEHFIPEVDRRLATIDTREIGLLRGPQPIHRDAQPGQVEVGPVEQQRCGRAGRMPHRGRASGRLEF